MKRSHRSSAIQSEDRPSFDLSSLIDVSFLLLIYFLATSTLEQKEADLGMTLPTTSNCPGDHDVDRIMIEITPQGTVLMSGEEVESATSQSDLPVLSERLGFYKVTAELMRQTPVVIVQASDSARCQRFIDVVNCVAGQQIKNVTLSGFMEE